MSGYAIAAGEPDEVHATSHLHLLDDEAPEAPDAEVVELPSRQVAPSPQSTTIIYAW